MGIRAPFAYAFSFAFVLSTAGFGISQVALADGPGVQITTGGSFILRPISRLDKTGGIFQTSSTLEDQTDLKESGFQSQLDLEYPVWRLGLRLGFGVNYHGIDEDYVQTISGMNRTDVFVSESEAVAYQLGIGANYYPFSSLAQGGLYIGAGVSAWVQFYELGLKAVGGPPALFDNTMLLWSLRPVPHLSAGYKWMIMNRFVVGVETGYHYAKFSSFKSMGDYAFNGTTYARKGEVFHKSTQIGTAGGGERLQADFSILYAQLRIGYQF